MDPQQFSYVPNQSNSVQYRHKDIRADTAHELCSLELTKSFLAEREYDRMFDDDIQFVMLSELGSVYLSLVLDEIVLIIRDQTMVQKFQLTEEDIVELAITRVKMIYPEFGK